MPEQTPERRGAGGATVYGLTLYSGRHYQPETLGGQCEKCGKCLPAALAGVTVHPTCAPEWPELLKASQRATRRRAAP